MKNGIASNVGKTLMKLNPISVIIIDDVKSYFNPTMLSIAGANGTISFERHYKCDSTLLRNLVERPRDILIIDIKGTVTDDIGRDGFDVANHIYKNTNTFVTITSAHKFHLKNRESYGDHVIAERLMTPIDFTEEMNLIISLYLKKKAKFYQKLIFKAGKYMFNYGVQ